MPATQRISVELPTDVARVMRDQVASGRYASESEAVVQALRSAHDEDRAVDACLRGAVAEAYDEIEAGTATLYTSDEVRAHLRSKR